MGRIKHKEIRIRWHWVFTPSQIQEMLNHYHEIPKVRGWQAKFARRWNLDWRRVPRFIAKYNKQDA